MGYQEIKVGQYASEALPDIIPKIQTGEDIMLKAQTGLGKTIAMLQLAELMPGKKIALLCPYRTLVDNIHKKHPNIPCGYRHGFLRTNKRSMFIVTTWDSLKTMMEWERPPELLIIDEAHLIVKHSTFREICRTILESDIQKVFMSATPEIIEKWHTIEHHIEIIGPKKYREVHLATLGNRNQKSLTLDLIHGRMGGDLLIIRYDNKKTLRDIFDYLPPKIQAVTNMYYSDEEGVLWQLFPDDTKELSSGVVPEGTEILLVTSIYDTGLSLTVSRNVDCYAISNDKRRMPHPVDMIQLQNRVRDEANHRMKLTVVGNYGDSEHRDIEVSSNKKPRKWLEYVYTAYQTYGELWEDPYKGTLEYYGVKTIDAKLPKKVKHAQLSNMRDIDIATNFASFPQYTRVEGAMRHNDCMDWATFINGTKDIRFIPADPSKTETRPEIIAEQLIRAIQCNLHFGLFMDGGRYYEKRVKNLIAAVDLYQKQGWFTQAIDQLFEGGIVDKVLPLDIYNDRLVEAGQNIFREVLRLFFDGTIKKERKQVKLKAKPLDGLQRELVYKECLINGKDDIW